jgi:hypothetical protein
MDHLGQLQQLKTLTITTGALHEAQVLQLKNYPHVLPDLKKSEVSVDIVNRIITYDLDFKVKAGKNIKTLKPECVAITKWIRTILWDDTIVVFKKSGKSLYDTRDQ